MTSGQPMTSVPEPSSGPAGGSGNQPEPQLRILYDGACPLCLREVRFLSQRDQHLHPGEQRLAFVDINDPAYDPAAHAGVDYRAAMGRMHGISADGAVLRDVAVFRRAYALIGLGWLYAPTNWPGVRQLANAAYGLWARWRLRLTGRASLEQLCSDRCRLGS
jgi:predicted DCC family thiol-disulfide oxidoreductase YuxK